MTTLSLFTALSDGDLLARIGALAAQERSVTAELIASLAELDARRLYLGAGCSSLFTYCTQVLHLSEHAAYGRIEAARAVRRHPQVLERLVDGSLTLTSLCLLAPILTEQNCVELLEAARHKSKRDVEQLVARSRPQPPVPSTIRKLPAPIPRVTPIVIGDMQRGSVPMLAPDVVEPVPLPPAPRPVVRPLAPEIYKVQFTLSRDAHDKLRRAQNLLRHSVPNGDVAAIFERALTLLVEDLEKKKLAATDRPHRSRPTASDSRHIPAAVKREIWKRDDGRCAFVGTEGRCTERGFLEIHHVVPFADGGEATVENLQLRCAAHNAYEAESWFGPGGAGFAREQPPQDPGSAP